MKYKTFDEWWDGNILYIEPHTPAVVGQKAWDAALESVKTKTRSNQQNRYYWGVVCHLASEHTGYTPEEIHEFHKQNFLTGIKHLFINNVTAVCSQGSTKDMTTKQFNEWIEQKLIPFWAEQDLYIPLPNEKELWQSYIKESEGV